MEEEKRGIKNFILTERFPKTKKSISKMLKAIFVYNKKLLDFSVCLRFGVKIYLNAKI
ncbi:MAG: hypothetical protein LBV16_07905 [Elusimicrobiota bacterium]|jgi:hypothetical protein|nr:hypothetical protein [Elusimicrobiota bacterium]